MARFDFFDKPAPGLKVVQRHCIEDERGFLSRMFCAEEFGTAGMRKPISQINYTLTRRKGTVRGMHYQLPPYGEVKIVSCLRGEVFDVAVDLRRNSETFLKWYGEVLSAANNRSLLIPEGFAHGFQALTTDCELVYLNTSPYRPAAEAALNAIDPRLAIAWPLGITEMSARDRGHSMLNDAFEGITV
jgi:dTDP-4-dehydrorhamnose 3,5-epimerase